MLSLFLFFTGGLKFFKGFFVVFKLLPEFRSGEARDCWFVLLFCYRYLQIKVIIVGEVRGLSRT